MKLRTFLFSLAILLGSPYSSHGNESGDSLRLIRIEMDISGMGHFTYSGNIAPGDTFTLPVPYKAVSDTLRNLSILDPESAILSTRVVAEPDPNETTAKQIHTETLGDLLCSLRGEPVRITPLQGDENYGQAR